MLAVIIVIAILCALFGIGSVLAKTAKVILWVGGGFFLVCVIIGILQAYGGVLLKAAGVILRAAIIIIGVLIVAAIVYGIYAKIKLALNTKKYTR